MLILGVDPGLKNTGWCLVLDGAPVGHGVIIPDVKGRLQPEIVLGWVCPELSKIIKLGGEYGGITYAAVEQVAYYGRGRAITLPLAHVAGGIVGYLLAAGYPVCMLLAAQRRPVKPWRGAGRWTEHERDAYALATVLRANRLAWDAGDASAHPKRSAVTRRLITTTQGLAHGPR